MASAIRPSTERRSVATADGPRVAVVSRRVHPAHGPGGLESAVHDQVQHLARAGVRVTLYSESPLEASRAVDAAAAFERGVGVHWVPGNWLPIGRKRGTVVLDRNTNYPAWSLRVAAWLDDDVDVVHVHGLAGWGLARRSRRGRLRAPLLLTTQGMEEFRSPGRLKHLAYAPFRAGMRRVARDSELVIATDRALFDSACRYHRIAASKVRVVPNVVNPEACRAAADRQAAAALLAEHGLEDSDPLFVSVGRIAPNKGFDLLPQALARAGDRLPPGWGWLLVGDGPNRPELEAAIRNAGLGNRCRLAGFVAEEVKHGLLARADWFVHPTLYEGSSLVTLEAMAHGLGVIASDTGGLRDKVLDGETGFLVQPGDIDALSAALLEAAATDRESLGAAGQALCEESFSWRSAIPLYLDLYAELIERHRGRFAG